VAEGETGDRTEAASPRRLQRAREDGQAPVSREVATLAVLGGGGAALAMLGPDAFARLAGRLSALVAGADRIPPAQAWRMAVFAAAAAAGPILLAAALAGILSHVAQTGPMLAPNKLMPDLARLSPLAGVKRLFGAEGAAETVKAVVKIGVVAGAIWLALRHASADLASAPFWSMATLLSKVTAIGLRILLTVLTVQAVIAAADLAWVRMRHARELRMSRFDVRQEQKESDGDPRVKARIKQLRNARARRRMLSEVRRATVVVTNPTHYAVALVYDRERNAAPRVVAKGVDSMAGRIREAAARHRVPLVANPPLARALHQVELERDIPPELFQAVAQIIAYVWGLQRRAAPRL
jgi:flagellar biosynthetic protein FlhB